MLVLLWPKYYGGSSTTGADPDPFGRRGQFVGPAQVLPDPIRRKPAPEPEPEDPPEEPAPLPPKPLDLEASTELAHALYKIAQLGTEVDDSAARFIVMQTALDRLIREINAVEEEEFAIFLLLTH